VIDTNRGLDEIAAELEHILDNLEQSAHGA